MTWLITRGETVRWDLLVRDTELLGCLSRRHGLRLVGVLVALGQRGIGPLDEERAFRLETVTAPHCGDAVASVHPASRLGGELGDVVLGDGHLAAFWLEG